MAVAEEIASALFSEAAHELYQRLNDWPDGEARIKSVQEGMCCVFHIPRINCATAHPGRLQIAKQPACRERVGNETNCWLA